MMGRTQVVMTVRGSVSSHNSLWDVIERGLWRTFISAVKFLAASNTFSMLQIEVDASDD